MAADGPTTLGILARAVDTHPDAVALIAGETSLTYVEYAASVAALAALLPDAHGRPVATFLRNGLAACVAPFAIQAAGGIAATLNPDYTASELAPMLADAAPAALICEDDLVDKARAALIPGADTRLIVLPQNPCALFDGLPIGPLPPPPDPDAHAVLQFTGGTTGRPKGVLLTHRAVATNVMQREARLPTIYGDERVLCIMPLFHSFAAAMCLHLSANAAGTLVILPRYRPDWVMDAIARHAITRLPAGPTVFNSLLAYEGFRPVHLRSLRCAYSGSAPLSAETLARWEARSGVPIYEGFGQSEAGPVLTYHGPATLLKTGSCGPALEGTELAIVDPATAARLPKGASGEIIARGPQIMTGYLNQPEATAATLRDGWLHTGDIGRLDADGYLFVEDRLKDLAIVGGYNVYPREVDEVLMRGPGVTEAGAVGVPDAYRGETIWAFVSGRAPDPDAIAAHCALHLVKYKWPSAIHVLNELPKTAAGKIDKLALKTMARGMANVT